MPKLAHQRGFTLNEFLLVLTLFSVVAAFMYPISVSLHNQYTRDETVHGIKTALRVAHAYARTQKNDSGHGIKIFSDRYVLFQGDSYTTRQTEYDEEIALPSAVFVSGLDEVSFSAYLGIPSATGSVVIARAAGTSTVSIRAGGVVE